LATVIFGWPSNRPHMEPEPSRINSSRADSLAEAIAADSTTTEHSKNESLRTWRKDFISSPITLVQLINSRADRICSRTMAVGWQNMNSDGEISFGFPFCQMDGPSTASVMNTCQVPCVLFPPLHPFFRSSDSPSASATVWHASSPLVSRTS